MTDEILIADACALDEKAIELMKSITDVRRANAHNEDELIQKIDKTSTKVIITDTVPITSKTMDVATHLKGIIVHGVGYDHIDVANATKRKIFVINQPGLNARSVAEFTITLLLNIAKKIPQAHLDTREGNWHPENFWGVEIYKKTLGIIGLGNIGRIVALIAKSIGMKVLYTDIIRNEILEKALCLQFVDKETLLRNSDFVTLHVPLTPHTKYLVGEKEFRLMKKGVRIINCSRGGIIDEKALCEAIEKGKVAGAVLDTTEQEPITLDNPILECKNIILTAHTAGITDVAQVNESLLACKQVFQVLKGEEPPYALV